MTSEFYHLDAVILNDAVYTGMGGQTGTASAAVRGAAYNIAERLMVEHLGTPLVVSSITGTFPAQHVAPNARKLLPHSYLASIDSVAFLSSDGGTTCGITETSGCSWILDSTFGIVDFYIASGLCSNKTTSPYAVRVAYQAGLPQAISTGSASLQLALTLVAESYLFEMMDPSGNEAGRGDIGIQEFVNMAYLEKRFPLRSTTFGSSPAANRAMDLVKHLRKHPAVGFGMGIL